MKKKLSLILSGLLVSSIMFTACSSSDGEEGEISNVIPISGSTSVGPLIEKEGEQFSVNNSTISVEVNQNGSSAGIKDAMSGTSEIGMTSRALKDDEKTGVTEVKVALDGIAVVVHKDCQVKDLTLQQVKDIFTGKITNWKDVGGPDAPIVVVSREAGSGTRGAFEEIIGYKPEELISSAAIANATGAVKETVAGNVNAIGYMSIGYLDDKVMAITVDGVEATVENIKNGTYKVQRPFLLVYSEDYITEQGKQFINFILSDEGQKIVEEDKLIRVK